MVGPPSPQIITPFIQSHRVFRPLFQILVPRSGSSFRILVPRSSFRILVPDPRSGSSFRILIPRSGSSFLVQDPRSSFRILVPRSGSSFLVPDLTLDLSQHHSNLKNRFTKSLRVMLSRRRDPLSILKLLHVRVKSEKVYMNYHHVHHRKEDLHNCQIYISLKVRLRWFGAVLVKL